MHLFYTPDITGGLYTLGEEESRHCLKVLRLGAGDIIHLTDGRGTLWEAEVSGESRKRCVVSIRREISGPTQPAFGYRPYHLHIAIAPTKNIDRFEWFLEKATEIGVDEITPLVCEHSERRVVRVERLEKVMTAAMKQSLKAWHPKLNQPASLGDFLNRSYEAAKFLAHDGEKAPLLQSVYCKSENAVVIIGPEGDFSVSEINRASAAGFVMVSLGNSRFRTETAGVLVCHTIYLVNAL